ncbi:MAG: preprotein translocase subunit YajC [Planctomycetota bacterium]
MTDFLSSLHVPVTSGAVCVAQAADAANRPEALVLQYLPLLAIAAAAYMLLFRPERERQRKQQELLASIRKNDRVVTAAGIYGTVAAVDRDGDRVTLKIDESSNSKLTVTFSSIARVIRDGTGGADEGSPG